MSSFWRNFVGLLVSWLCGHKDTQGAWRGRKCWPTCLRKRMWSLVFLWLHLLCSGCIYCPTLKIFPEVAVLMASSPNLRGRKYLFNCYKQGTEPWANRTSEKNMVQAIVAAPGCQEIDFFHPALLDRAPAVEKFSDKWTHEPFEEDILWASHHSLKRKKQVQFPLYFHFTLFSTVA